MVNLYSGVRAIRINKIWILISVMLLCGCTLGGNNKETEFYKAASALTKLSAAVEATVRYEGVAVNADSEEIIRQATRHDKTLLSYFSDYELKVHVEARHAIVLLCNKEKTEMHLEDAGCSAEMDVHHWKTKTIQTCEATLDLNETCQ